MHARVAPRPLLPPAAGFLRSAAAPPPPCAHSKTCSPPPPRTQKPAAHSPLHTKPTPMTDAATTVKIDLAAFAGYAVQSKWSTERLHARGLLFVVRCSPIVSSYSHLHHSATVQ
jgi:hypothetical protein